MKDCKECENLRREIVSLKGQIADMEERVHEVTCEDCPIGKGDWCKGCDTYLAILEKQGRVEP